MTGYICGPRIYEYRGIIIELPGGGGPWPLNKSGNAYQRVPGYVVDIVNDFWSLSEEDQEKYRTGGGCQRFGNE